MAETLVERLAARVPEAEAAGLLPWQKVADSGALTSAQKQLAEAWAYALLAPGNLSEDNTAVRYILADDRERARYPASMGWVGMPWHTNIAAHAAGWKVDDRKRSTAEHKLTAGLRDRGLLGPGDVAGADPRLTAVLRDLRAAVQRVKQQTKRAAEAGHAYGLKAYNERLRAGGLAPVRARGEAEAAAAAPAEVAPAEVERSEVAAADANKKAAAKPHKRPARAKKTAKPEKAAKPKKTAKKYTARDLARGALIEQREHGIDRKTARKLARDHLEADPAAYRGKKVPPAKPKKTAKPKAAKKRARPTCAGSISRLVVRYEEALRRRSSALATRQAARRDRLLARQQAREHTLAAQITGSAAARARGTKRLAAAKKRHQQQLAELDRQARAEQKALPRVVECYILGHARAAKLARDGCEDLCNLNLAGGIGGDKTAVALPSARSTPRMLPARFVLVSASRLVASHDPSSLDPRPDYPAGVQERRYERDAPEKLKVIDIAQNMQPALIVNTNAGAVDGTPIVTPEGVVLSGNGRTMGAQRHYLSGRRVLADYLQRHAVQFGIDPRAVATIKDPIVVRVIDVPAQDRARLVRDFNVGLTQSMSAEVEAAALARQLPADVPRLLRDGEADRGLAEYLTSRASLPLIGALERSGYINRANRSRLLGSDGLLTAEGRADLERMLVAAVLPVDLVERSPELARAMERSAVSWLVAAGAGPDWDVRPDLAAAAEDYLSLRASKMCLAQWQQQATLAGPRTSSRPMATALLEALDLAAARPVVFSRIAAGFAAASRTGGGLFGSVEPVEALRKAAAGAGVDTSKAASRRRCRKAA